MTGSYGVRGGRVDRFRWSEGLAGLDGVRGPVDRFRWSEGWGHDDRFRWSKG